MRCRGTRCHRTVDYGNQFLIFPSLVVHRIRLTLDLGEDCTASNLYLMMFCHRFSPSWEYWVLTFWKHWSTRIYCDHLRQQTRSKRFGEIKAANAILRPDTENLLRLLNGTLWINTSAARSSIFLTLLDTFMDVNCVFEIWEKCFSVVN